jgi:16S rRNA (cytidine1402-2'-O)-methyltransferase
LHSEHADGTEPTLYVVATPIGNLQDITLRAIEVLKRADAIAAEDTRVTQRLLGHCGITTRLLSLHEHNENQAADRIIGFLAEGKSVALVSDAGTPALSDPGAGAVARVREKGYRIVPIPGPNAAVTAISASGFAVPPFCFHGFLPARKSERDAMLEKIRIQRGLQVFYEAPHRIVEMIESLESVFGSARAVCIARELTKIFEQIHCCRLGEASGWLGGDENRRRGEFVVLVEGYDDLEPEADAENRRVLELLLEDLPLKQAVKLAAGITKARKNELYELALTIKKT